MGVRLPAFAEQPAIYANHTVVNVSPNEVLFTFAQVLAPPFVDPAEMAAVIAEGKLDGRIVVQITMPHSKFVELVDSLTNLVVSLRQQGALPGGEEH